MIRRVRLSRGLDHYSIRGIAIRLFITCWLVYALHFATNIVREIYPALSLAENLSFDVSEYVGLHPDIFEMPGRGAYINNNPGASVLGAIPYAVARPVVEIVVDRVQEFRASDPVGFQADYQTTRPNRIQFYKAAVERGLDVKFGLAAGLMQGFLMAPLSALSVVIMFLVLVPQTTSVRVALGLSLLYAFATPIFYRTSTLNQNVLIGTFAFFSFVLLWRPWAPISYPFGRYFFLAGLLAGWTIVLDYSAVVAIASLSLYTLIYWRSFPENTRKLSSPIYFAIGVAICLGFLLFYQWSSFGSPLYPAQHYMPPTIYSIYGYNGMDWPQLDLLWATTFGIRFGYFTSAPLMLLAFYIPAWFRGRLPRVGKREVLFIAFFSIAFFIFAAANQFGRLQFNTGVRYVVPITPFLFLIVAGVLLKMPSAAAVFISVFSVYWSWCLVMYQDVIFGRGILEAVIRITLEGFRLPWVTTLELTGYIPSGVYATRIILVTLIIIVAMWSIHLVPSPESAKSQKSLV